LTRAVATVALVPAWLLLHVTTAFAADGSGELGQTPPSLLWIQLEDSRGISIWNFELSLDRGGVTSPDKFFWASITEACWGFYRSMVALALWFLDWVMSFGWLHIVAAPMIAVGDAMQSVVYRVGAVPALLTIAAVAAVAWMMRGRWATGIFELAVALVIAALATGVFAQPVRMVAGDDGLIAQSQQWGLELSAALAGQGAAGASPEQLRKAQTGVLVDTFVRIPTEMINFGRVLDGGKCEGAYDQVVKAGPYGYESDIRDKVGDCDATLKDYADQPTASMALGSLVFMPASFVILLMSLVLAGSVVAAGCYAIYQSVKAIVSLVTGLLPGGSRGSLMLTFTEAAISLLIILFTSVFLGIFLQVIQALFRSGTGDAVPKTFVIVDVLLLVGVIIYLRQRKRFKEASHRMAELLSKRPGTSATRMPSRSPGSVGSGATRAAALGIGVMHARASLINARKPPPDPPVLNLDARRQMAMFFGGPGQGGQGPVDGGEYPVVPGPGPGGPRGGGGGGGPHTPLPGPGGGLKRIEARKPRALGTLVRAGTSTALAVTTGGSSAAVTGTMTAVKAGKAVNGARALTRSAVRARMALPAGPSAALQISPAAGAAALPSGRSAPAKPLPGRTKPAPPIAPRPSRPTAPPTNTEVSSSPSTTPERLNAPLDGDGPPARRPLRSTPAPTSRGMSRQWDKVVRDGQVILVPKDLPPPPTPRPPRRTPRGT
jgi:hypothetical protein